jgi:hypothetical protein
VDNLVDVALCHHRVREHLLHGEECLPEEVCAELLKLGSRDRLREVNPRKQRLELNAHLRLRRERTLRTLRLAPGVYKKHMFSVSP